jgi:23S rRNA (uridine2552-2'-O)-methyltransferase
VTGVWEVDHACQIDLGVKAMEIAKCILKPGGTFFVKVFQGDLLDKFILSVKESFEEVKIVKPPASRQKSSEEYLLALGLKVGICKKTES